MAPIFLLFAAFSGLTAVGLGAFAAHGLKARLASESLLAFQTGVQYQMYHALVLIGIALIGKTFGQSGALTASGWLLIVGMVLFSGSLYILALGGPRWVGPITPLGGLCLLLGWLALLVEAVRIWRF